MEKFNLNLPKMKSSEIFTSYIARVAVTNALDLKALCRITEIKALNLKCALSSYDRICGLFKLNKSKTEIVLENTSMKLYKTMLLKSEFNDDGLPNPEHMNELNDLFTPMICPLCAKEDYIKVGHPIRYVHHNYYGIKACTKHRAKLEGFYDFGRITPDLFEAKPATDEDVEIAEWFIKLSNQETESAVKLIMDHLNELHDRLDDYSYNDRSIIFTASRMKSLQRLPIIYRMRLCELIRQLEKQQAK